MIKETTTTDSGDSTDFYVWGLDVSGTFQGAGGIGGLLSNTNDLTGTTFLYTFDLNGNVGQLIDSSTGSIAAHYEYDPFGNTLVADGPEAEKNPYRFSTKHVMSEFGWYDYGYRFYAARLGRWPNRDLIEEHGGWNLYGFVGNSPFHVLDALGLYTYLGTEYFHGIENSGGKIGTVEIAGEVISRVARTLGSPTIDVETSVVTGGCQCCIVDIEFSLKHKVYLPLIGETFRENSVGPILETTVDALHLELLTRHENAHVEAEKQIAKALFEKAEADFQGKCWAKWFCKTFKRTWEEKECQSYAKEKINTIVGRYWKKTTDEAERKLNHYQRLSQSDFNDYLQWVNNQCASWEKIQFIKKEQETTCQ